MEWNIKKYSVPRIKKTATVKLRDHEILLYEILKGNGVFMTGRATLMKGETQIQVMYYSPPSKRDQVIEELTNMALGKEIKMIDAMSGKPIYKEEA